MRPEALLLAAALGLSGCAGCQPPGPHGGGDGGDGGGRVDAGYATSSKAALLFKRNVRLTADLAQALSLTAAEVCNELGQYPCTTVVHALTLGGVDPYGSGLYEPIPFTGITSPIAVDRVALAACTARVDRDLAAPALGAIYKLVAIDGAGKLANPDGVEVDLALDALYQRALLREPTAQEKAHHRALYAEVLAAGKPQPARAWMILACFAVTTSVEFLFY